MALAVRALPPTSAPTCLAQRAVVVVLLAVSMPARADWLVELRDCDTASRPELSLSYPRRGLPAVAQAGTRLVFRVRLPLALTPPPGIQQPRALARWGARLRGRAYDLASGAPAVYAYALEVTDVRPDAASTLVYRATVPLPAWLAPGSYDLALGTPAGEVTLARSVRVLPAGASPRLSVIDVADLQHPGLASAPVDVWIVDSTPGAPVERWLQPWLAPGHAAALVAVGPGDRRTVGTCPGELPLADARSFADALPPPARGSHRLLGADETSVLSAVVVEGLGGGAGLRVTSAGGGELAVLAPGTRSVTSDAASVAWYPAVGLAQLPADAAAPLVGRLAVAAGQGARLTLSPASTLRSRARIAPVHATPGAPVEIVLEGAPEGRVAWLVGQGAAAHTAFGPRATRHAFAVPGRHAIRALEVSDDGRARAVVGWAETRMPARGCSALPGGGARVPGWRALWLLGFLLKRRRRPDAGNMLRREAC